MATKYELPEEANEERLKTLGHGTKNWIYSKFDLDQKSGSNMIIALIHTLTRVKCVSKMFMALPIHLILDKEEGKCDLNFDSTFDARPGADPGFQKGGGGGGWQTIFIGGRFEDFFWGTGRCRRCRRIFAESSKKGSLY